jgi:hypothetical protein
MALCVPVLNASPKENKIMAGINSIYVSERKNRKKEQI